MAAPDDDSIDPDLVEDLAPVNARWDDERARAGTWEATGVLFFRRVLDPDLVNAARVDLLDVLRQDGVVEEGSALWTGASAIDFARLYDSAGYRRLLEADSTLAFLGRVLGEPVQISAAILIRCALPGDTPRMIPPHQDGAYSPNLDFRTIWIPLMDIPREVGGLAVLEGSHRVGQLPLLPSTHVSAYAPDKRKTRVSLVDVPGRWATASFRAGDCLVFHPHVVHAPLPNCSRQVRLSVDVRIHRRCSE